ncbi:hypothetical protein [uncultured Maribacter sp.]|uniref:hypothetical protein n=1 Tax=uncultured Maribacter sp. TaxID=431308 RepID=UPI00345D9E89
MVAKANINVACTTYFHRLKTRSEIKRKTTSTIKYPYTSPTLVINLKYEVKPGVR